MISLMSLGDFAKLIKRPLNTLKTWKKRGELPEYLFKKVGGCVYVSRAVADALEGRVRFTSLGDSIKLKGKAAGFEVLRGEELLDKN